MTDSTSNREPWRGQGQGQYDKDQIRRVVTDLSLWSAELGSADAQDLIAELALDGRLLLPPGTDAKLFAYEHEKIAEALYASSAKPDEASKASGQANAIRPDLSEDDVTAATTRAAGFKPVTFTDLPPWLSGGKENVAAGK